MQLQSILDDKTVTYYATTEFIVESGIIGQRYTKKTTFIGDLVQAVTFFNAVKIEQGYQKRLIAPSLTRKLLAKESKNEHQDI